MVKITFKGKTLDCKYYKGLAWNKTLTPEMKAFERRTGSKAVFRGVVTGTFEYHKYWKTYDDSLKKPRGFQKGHQLYRRGKLDPKKVSMTKAGPKKNVGSSVSKFKQLTETEVKELYARKFGIKGGAGAVKVTTKKFQLFAAKMLINKTK